MSLQRLLEPRAVAIVGASADANKISGMMVEFLHRSGYAGRVYPINPRYDSIRDWRCYPSVEALPETVDVVVIAVPVGNAFAPLEQAARRGVPFAVLMTGGFGEGTSGEEGNRRRERLLSLCAESGMRVVGPNTVGMVNFRGRMPLTFADWYGRDTGQRGGVAILTHSGSVGGLIFSSLQIANVGVDYWIATGNEANLEIADFIEHLSDVPGLHTIACFMEGVVDGRKFMRAVDKAHAAGKRVAVLKAGSSEASLRSTEAHTVKRSSAPDVYRGVFGQLGIVQVRSLQELTYAVKLLGTLGTRARGNVGILSASGGACSLIADHVVHAGLALPELDPGIQRELARSIPEYGSTRNPVDLSADVVSRRDIVDGTFATLAHESAIDTWVVFGRPVIDRYHAEIRAFARVAGKAVLVSSGVALRADIDEALQQGGVPALEDPDTCMRALAALARTARASAASRDTRAGAAAVPRRGVGAPLDARPLAALLQRHAITVDGAGVTGTGERVRRGDVVLALRQDADFGPVLTIEPRRRHAWREAARVTRALPLTDADVAGAIEELDALLDGALSPCASELARVLRALAETHASERDVAEIVLEARSDAASVIVTRASACRASDA